MSSRAKATWSVVEVLVLLSVGCGARTGLTLDSSSDADLGPAPDVFGPFPCLFSPVGQAAPIREGPDQSFRGRMEFGGGRLGLLYNVADSPGSPTTPRLSFCFSIPYGDEVCSPETEVFHDGALNVAPLAWGGDVWGLCRGRAFETLSPGGAPLTEVQTIGSPGSICRDLVASASGYVASFADTTDSPSIATVAALDQSGVQIGEPLHTHEMTGPQTRLAAHDGMAIAAWAGPDWLVLRRLDGDGPYLEVLSEAEARVDHLDVALRRPIAGVFWHEHRDGSQVLLFRLVDMDRGQLATSVEVARPPNVAGLDIIAVNEGFVVAWLEWSEEGADRIVVVPIGVDGWESSLFSELVLYDEPHDATLTDLGGPAMAYDERAVFVTFTRRDVSTGLYQVHFQQLDCHR